MPNHQIEQRIAKLIPTLEYDVLYRPSFIAKNVNSPSYQLVVNHLNEISYEMDLALIGLSKTEVNHKEGELVMRIGEQDENLPILQQPVAIPTQGKDILWCKKGEYLRAYSSGWSNLAKALNNRGIAFLMDARSDNYIESSDHFFVSQEVFRDFIAEGELPFVVHQDYRIGLRSPILIYHPKILRQVRDSKK